VVFCNERPVKDSWSDAFNCASQRFGMATIQPHSRAALHTHQAEKVWWGACRSPQSTLKHSPYRRGEVEYWCLADTREERPAAPEAGSSDSSSVGASCSPEEQQRLEDLRAEAQRQAEAERAALEPLWAREAQALKDEAEGRPRPAPVAVPAPAPAVRPMEPPAQPVSRSGDWQTSGNWYCISEAGNDWTVFDTTQDGLVVRSHNSQTGNVYARIASGRYAIAQHPGNTLTFHDGETAVFELPSQWGPTRSLCSRSLGAHPAAANLVWKVARPRQVQTMTIQEFYSHLAGNAASVRNAVSQCSGVIEAANRAFPAYLGYHANIVRAAWTTMEGSQMIYAQHPLRRLEIMRDTYRLNVERLRGTAVQSNASYSWWQITECLAAAQLGTPTSQGASCTNASGQRLDLVRRNLEDLEATCRAQIDASNRANLTGAPMDRAWLQRTFIDHCGADAKRMFQSAVQRYAPMGGPTGAVGVCLNARRVEQLQGMGF